jgi:hypothetical protein
MDLRRAPLRGDELRPCWTPADLGAAPLFAQESMPA